MKRMERAIAATHHDLGRGLWTLASIASTAFWFSSLAVLNGIINSFGGLSTEAMYGRRAISGGLAEALATEALGLLVALFACFAHRLLKAQRARLIEGLRGVAA
jgi:biopolymer transport protein ExbB/TolQ